MGGFCFVVTFSKEAGPEEINGQDAGLGKAIAATANFEVDPTVAVSTRKVVFINEFLWNVCDFDADILRVGDWCVKCRNPRGSLLQEVPITKHRHIP